MARSPTTATAPKAPDFIAWHVNTKGENTYWTRIGASWLHNDGNGLTVHLEAQPIGGRIVLRASKADSASQNRTRD